MIERNIYMDNNATTRIDPVVKEAVLKSFDLSGNASSMHGPGRAASAAINRARIQTAKLIGADPEEIIFTSGGSESNNTVLHLIYTQMFENSGRKRIITSSIEHPSVIETVEAFKKKGVPVTVIGVDAYGKLDMEALRGEAADDVALISVMMANNEIGTIQDIARVAEIAASCGALVHTDAVQAAGKIVLDVHELNVDFASISGHKLHGPKGIGALYIRKGLNIEPLIHGGHQEHGQRAGTYNTPGIIGLGAAADIAFRELAADMVYIQKLKDRLYHGIKRLIPDVHINGHPVDVLPGTLNVSFPGAEGESILLYLDMEGISVSTGSACATGSLEPSYVLIETGVGAELAHGSIRFSLGKFNTENEVDFVLEILPPVIKRLREMSTL
ncbi:MAG: aminotransferase class V-fold PLP-dependent enzyme [Spirochaetia bacterium]|nr:aminotransferase class V-fold PLP-dependent enzyme [Spirochaetia bacterium]